ncbi:MAG: PKD domain-containing protein [Bacteroidetes bacterium]|nr:PKD domain-containing protein [Bacteroidota bacterium]
MSQSTILRCLILGFVCLFYGLQNQIYATHVMGTDFAYECLGNGKYRIIINLYRDCNGIQMSNYVGYSYKCKSASGTGTTVSANRISVTDVTGIDSACGVVSKCKSGSNFAYGIEQHVYVDTLDLSSLNCCEVSIIFVSCCRNNGISTGASGQNFYADMTINKCLSACNSSPKYTNYPVAIVCKDQDVVLNSGATDTIDVGDSLSYELTQSLTSAGNSVTYSGSFSYNKPLTFLGFPNANQSLPYGFHLDPTTGDLAFRPTSLNQMSVVAFKVKEWRKDSTGTWAQIGETRRDLQVIVISCVNSSGVSNDLPSLPAQPIAKVCSGDSICMRIVTSDANSGDSVRLTWNKGIPGASFTIVNPGQKYDTAYVCWKPSVKDTSSVPYAFTITAKDDACPFPGSTTRAFSIQVGLKPETKMSYTIDTCGLIEMNSTPLTTYVDPLYTWIITDTATDTVFKSVSYAKNAYSFLSPGKYYVYHKIATSFPCYSDFYDSFNVASYPVVRTSLPNDTAVCTFSSIHLDSKVSGGVAPLKYSWNTSSTDTLTSKSLIIEYDSLLIVTVSDKYGCYHRDSVNATAWALPKASIYVPLDEQCFSGNEFSFYDSTRIEDGSNLARTWILGESDSSSLANASKHFSSYDTFAITLYSKSKHGCLDTAYDSVIVHPQATPRIHLSDSAQCLLGNHYVFDSKLSTIPYESIDTSFWDFGDTTGDTAQTVQKTYSRYGYMNVRLITQTQSGCLDTAWQSVRVNPNPKLSITINDSLVCLSENEVQLDALNSSIDDGYIASLSWDYADGHQDTGWSPATYAYSHADTFLVRLNALSDQQCGDTTWQNVVIHPQSQIRLLVDTSEVCYRGNIFHFDGSKSTVSSGSIVQFVWNYDDGQFDYGAQHSHTYSNYDSFRVRLVTATHLYCRDTAYQLIIVHPQTSLDFVSNLDSQCLNLNNFSFDASGSQIPWGSIDRLYWDFGNTVQDTGWLIQNFMYQNAGTFTVRLASKSDYGCRDTVRYTRVVHPRMTPVIQSNYYTHCFSFHSFQFDASLSQIPWGSIDTFQWDLEDGANFRGMQPAAYSFNTADSFDVRLISTSNEGCKDTTFSEVVVYPQPVARIDFNEDEHCLSGNDFRFDASSSSVATGNITNYHWDFGDGASSDQILVAHKIYGSNGSYVLKLRVETGLSCADSAYAPIVVHPQMVPKVQIVDSFVCIRGNFFDLNASSSTIPYGGIQSYLWSFNDGTNLSGALVQVRFAYYDTFNFQLKTISDKACEDSISRKLIVYPQPTARFVINDSIQCFDKRQAFDFDANSSSVPDSWSGIVKYEWSSDDPDTHSGQYWLNKTFASRGVYTIQLRVQTKDGCWDTTERKVLFYPAMVPGFTTHDTAQCFNEHSFVFNGTNSRIPLGSISKYTWKYEDQTSSTGLFSPPKRFATYDTFTVWLVTTSNENCEDSTSGEVIVFESPTANFSVPETCLKQASIFTDESATNHDTLISWHWQFGDQDTSIEQNPVHYYKGVAYYDVVLSVESQNHCFHDTMIPGAAWVKELPLADFTFERVNFDFEKVEFHYTDHSQNPISWDWDFGDGQSSSYQNPNVKYADTAHYRVQLIVSNDLNCLDTTVKTVWALPEFLLYMPNAFSPNADGNNETFGPSASQYFIEYKMQIFNRWGEMLFETEDLNQRWDGRFRGEVCESEVYLYKVHIIDLFGKIHNLNGVVTLLH